MKTAKISAVILMVFVMAVSLAALQKKRKPQEKIYIPPVVKNVMEEGLQEMKGRDEIPFEILKSTFLPAQNDQFVTFIFEVRNEDLGFPPPSSGDDTTEAAFNVFLWFHSRNGDDLKTAREHFVPAKIEIDAESYDPDQQGFYSVSTILPPDNYVLAMSITSPDLKKIGAAYFSFELPEPFPPAGELALTPVLFVDAIRELPSPEVPPVVHKDVFVYSAIEVRPKIKPVFAIGEVPDIFYFIYGSRPDPENPQSFEIEITYRVKKGEEELITFTPRMFHFPIVSHPVPLHIGEEKDLGPGAYVLEMDIRDTISGNAVREAVEFEVVGKDL